LVEGLRNVTAEPQRRLEIVEGANLDEARLDGVRLAAREMAHVLNNDLAVAVGLVELLQGRPDLPPRLRDLLADAADSLDAATRHIEDFQDVVRVAVKDTPGGPSLDLEQSRHA
jgi:signal transduction histidine kinase